MNAAARSAQAAFLCDTDGNIDSVYAAGRRQRIEELTDCRAEIITTAYFAQPSRLGELEFCFRPGECRVSKEAELERLPNLKAVSFAAGSFQALFHLPNVLISSHIAGSKGDELMRMADFAIEEFLAWKEGRPFRFAISPEDLEKTA